MTTGEYVDYIFGMATGWLGWPPDVAWSTPVPQIYLAIDAKVDWTMQTNPFGSPEKPKKRTDIRAALKERFSVINKVRKK